MDNATIRQEARERMKGNYGTAIGAVVVMALIQAAAGAIPIIGAIGSLVISGPLSMGLCLIFLNIIRKKEPAFEQLFSGFSHFSNALVAYFFVVLFTLLWLLLLIIPGIIASYRYSMTFFILADNPDLDGNEARKRSIEMMEGHKARLFWLHLSYIGWLILCGLSFGILAFWVVPWMANANSIFYDELKNSTSERVSPQLTAQPQEAP